MLIDVFGPSIKISVVRFNTDNTQAMAAINKQTSSVESSMVILRQLVLRLFKYNIHINLKAQYLPGKFCVMPNLDSKMLRQYEMELNPIPIPENLLPRNFRVS